MPAATLRRRIVVQHLAKTDPEIHRAILDEINRQHETLELIASENHCSLAVLEALGQPMTNKYAEGYPGKRYYGGCEFVDNAEELARERACRLFGADHANVQPHSGSQANLASYFTFLKPGDTILGMNLAHGGHLTHGSPVNFSGKIFNVVFYGVDAKTERVDMNQVRDLAQKHKPKMIIVGASAYSRQFEYDVFREIADEVNAKVVADIAHPAGLIAAKLLDNPLPHCHAVTTTTHKTLRGPRGGMILVGNDEENDMGLTTPKGRKKKWSELIDSAVFPGFQGGPLMHVIAAKAVAFKEALQIDFIEYSRQVIHNAQAMSKKLMDLGYDIVSGGTDNHLLLVDLRNRDLTGKDAEAALEKAGITVNKNMVPNDHQPPTVTSGIRIGTPALTTRGMKENEMREVAFLIDKVLSDIRNETARARVREQVLDLSQRFPLYAELTSSE
ncbi:serine hydroxymethyltransferase [candidate division KSB1 bacterium]|nr:MAG: serine hydroxymethyltransferase [candidate division KSB1 bacterium]MBC6947651.1 serine hydroxymethyltransferase [candidate division KSB1 bacterium]MCE7942245.1 serine hydroxymethyltransferase [Chlorobi bacterium CHB1]MDL1874346.1 serine hydroxymethyltransferase [Cytophagia bacterium CHB2]